MPTIFDVDACTTYKPTRESHSPAFLANSQLLKHSRRFQFEDRATQMGIVCRGESNRADRLLTDPPPPLVAPAVLTFW